MKQLMIIKVDFNIPESCRKCRFCTGEYGPGNEKSYCMIDPTLSGNKLKYGRSRPSNCPIQSMQAGAEK